jgi:pimeloyl-ACP methyl ester carboxylesterase
VARGDTPVSYEEVPGSVLGVTDFKVVDGVRVAMRSFGAGDPLVLLNRFRGTMDNWDPVLVTALGRERRVIMFDSVGIGETGGEPPRTVEALADFAARVLESFSSGGDGPPWLLARRAGSSSSRGQAPTSGGKDHPRGDDARGRGT